MQSIFKFLSIFCFSFFLFACSSSTSPMTVTEAPKPGFSNITDIPIPTSAQINFDKSIVMGSGDNWTGHLVYTLNRSRASTIDFLSTQMVANGWAKISELRGAQTTLVFMKSKRVATFRITGDNKNTSVNIDMTNSEANHVTTDSKTNSSYVFTPQQ